MHCSTRDASAILVGLLLSACDPTFSLRLHVRVTERNQPAAGVWILSLNDGRVSPATATKTGPEGRAEVLLSAFLHLPAGDPLALATGPDRILVLVPGRDFHPRKPWFGYEWEASVDTPLVPRPPELALTCHEERCRVESPLSSVCTLYEVHVDAVHAVALRIDELSSQGGVRPVRGEFTPAEGARDLVVVAVCLDDHQLKALTSNSPPSAAR